MKIRGKEIKGFIFNGKTIKSTIFHIDYTSDFLGKTLSIDNGEIQYTIPFDEIYKMIKE